MIRRMMLALFALSAGACSGSPKSGEYLYVWAGDSAHKASDFLAVIDANPKSAHYGGVVSMVPTGSAGTMPHHTENEVAPDGHLLANGFMTGKSFLFDLNTPTAPTILTSFGDVAGYSHPHSFVRLADGNVLATFQYLADSAMSAVHAGMAMTDLPLARTGGLVVMDERGTVIRSGSARDTVVGEHKIFPYSVLPIASIDRAISTTTDMNQADTVATAEWIQFWRLSDLKLLSTVALKPGPRGDEQKYTGEPRLLADGKSVYVHTFNCGLYLVRGIDTPTPTAAFVMSFPGKDCGVPILAGHYWLQTVPESHALVSMDVSDPEKPRQVSQVSFGSDEQPHWIALDPTGRRIVLNSGGYVKGNRIFIINFDPTTGKLQIDDKFRDAGSAEPGVNMTGKHWPNGFAGTAMPHGTVFSR